ncbi:hypothetical protein BKA58DRAFT_391324 [Alternaria rosae]|uniref:uncharacterized protein n=1 Tax=Alternaria rosae TaxID=1187941 RepID=UPI001E8D3138|nr:uncharacterized protein BKA58DRAFT_391324 [Alternaria rosae]KAH6865064.1 hypothetical protein BKA58DRAFT_391324 [Alternaria rosae]
MDEDVPPALSHLSQRAALSRARPALSLQRIVGAGACEACRGRITKCSTERPQCSECRKRHSPCNYLQPAVRPVAASARRYHGQAQVQVHHDPQHALLRHVFAHLRSQPLHVAQELLGHLRRDTDVRTILRFLEYGSLRLQLKLVPDTTYQFTAPYLADMMPLFDSADNPYLASRLYKALSHETAHHGTDIQQQTHSAIYHVPYPGARMYDPRMSPDTLRPSRWTSISDDDIFLTRLLEGYFLYEFPLWPCFHKDHFLDDMTAGRTDYSSPLLVSAILTAACHGLNTLEQRSEFWNPSTYSYRCMAETRQLWELEQSQAVCSLPTIQAATIIGRIYFANGMDKMGWTMWSHALALADRLDLFAKAAQYNNQKDRISRTITAWGIFSQQAFSCFYLMKPPLSRLPPENGLPEYQDAHDFFGEIWVKYPLATHVTPVYLGQTFLSLMKLRCIMNDIAGKALPEDGGDNNLDIEQASRYHSMLIQWFRDLPEPLQPQNVAMPTQLLLHMQFHNLVTMTFQPFLEKEKSLNWPNNSGAFQRFTGFSPAQLYATSKASLQTLLHMFYHRHGFEAYYIFLLQVLVQLGFDSIERLRTPEAQQEHFPAIMKATRATLILCAKGLRDQGHNFFLSELVFRILRDKMNPVDVELLKDWAHIKDEDEREKSMMEHVHGEYPVNVESITSDPTEQRLNRLLQTMGDLKLPNDTAEPTQQERASRTWRSIVF